MTARHFKNDSKFEMSEVAKECKGMGEEEELKDLIYFLHLASGQNDSHLLDQDIGKTLGKQIKRRIIMRITLHYLDSNPVQPLPLHKPHARR
jgi:hypothetical protein